MADFNVTECVIENVNGAAFLRPQKSYSIAIAGTSTTSSIPISANTQVVRLATPSSCHFRLGAGATTSDAMIPAGEVVDFSVQPDGGTSYLSVIEASSPTDIGGGGVGDSGLESVNVQTLAGNKTITSTDARVQLLNPGGAVVRTITLDSSLHVVGTKVTICNTDSLDGAYNYGSLHVVNSVAVGLHSQDLLYGGSESWVYTGTGATGWVRVTGVPGGQSYVGTIILGNQAFYVQNFTVTGNQLGIGGSPSSLFHVTAAGNANALRVDNTTGYTGIGMAPGTEQLSFAGNGRQLGANLYVSDITTASANKAWNLRGVNYASSTNFNLVGYNATNAAIVIQYGAAEAKYVLFYADSVSSFRIVDRNVGVGVADPSSLFHVTAAGNANALRVDNTTGYVGIGVSPRSPLHVIGTDLRIATNDTDATNKVGCVVVSNYTNANSPFALVVGTTGTSYNYLALGAQGDGSHTSCTTGFFYAAASSSATGGIVCVGRWTSTGFGVGDAQPSSLFHVTTSGNSNALRVDNTTGNLGIGAAPDAISNIYILFPNTTNGARAFSVNHSNTVTGNIEHYFNVNATGNGIFTFCNGDSGGNAIMQVYVPGGSTTGDAFYKACINGAQNWSWGLDNSDSDVWKLSSGHLGDFDCLRVTATGIITCPNTTGAFSPPVLTTTQRDALTAVKGMIVYNATTDKHQGYNGAWTDFY